MNITIGKPCAISEKGLRPNNEDAIFPLPESVSSHQKLFIVCDGVGGAEKGEVASSLACEYFQAYFSTFLTDEPTPDLIRKALRYTEAHFDNYVREHPEATGMATTLTMIYVGNGGVVLAHIGDSRIYQIRDGQIVYRTEDHSLVQSLVRLGQITEEEARRHPKKNVITRAIQGTATPTEADVVRIDDVQSGDYFFLCTDGVLEAFPDDARLAALFRKKTPSEIIKDTLMESCSGNTRDNFSFYIIPIQNVQESESIKQNILSFFYSFV